MSENGSSGLEWLEVGQDVVAALRAAGFAELGDVHDASDVELLKVIAFNSLKVIRDQLGQE